MAFHSAGLFGRYQDRAVEETVLSLQSFLEGRGLRVFLGDTTASEIAGPVVVGEGYEFAFEFSPPVASDVEITGVDCIGQLSI